MAKSKTVERLLRFLITMLGGGLGAGVAALALPWLASLFPQMPPYAAPLLYAALGLLGALVFFLFSYGLYQWMMRMTAALEHRWADMPTRQMLLTASGLVLGLLVAALVTQLILSAGATFLTITFSAMVYVLLGYMGLRLGYRRYGALRSRRRRGARPEPSESDSPLLEQAARLLDDDDEPTAQAGAKYLDTSVLIDGRIADVAKAGFLEGDLVAPQFVLDELRHIADSADGLRRARGRRGLEVLERLQKIARVTVDETDYPDDAEVDVKLLRLARDKGGAVVTNDYNLNKVAGVSGIKVLNLNDLANAVKPMLAAGEELRLQILREGKEPGQGVGFLDDGTMIVVEGGRRHVGEQVAVIVNTVLQTSAGRMIFTKLKDAEA